MNTRIHTHTHRNTHKTGWGREAWQPRGAGSAALMVCQSCTTCTAALTKGCSSMPPSSSATLWSKGARMGEGSAHLQGVEPVWTQPSEFSFSILGPAWPSRVGTATAHRRSLCSHWALALVCPSPSHRGDSCQHTLGKADLWPAQLQLCPKTSGHTDCTETRTHKDSPANQNG